MSKVEFQRRHFNWFVSLMGQMDLTQAQTNWMIVRLSETNANFNEARFRAALSQEMNMRGI